MTFCVCFLSASGANEKLACEQQTHFRSSLGWWKAFYTSFAFWVVQSNLPVWPTLVSDHLPQATTYPKHQNFPSLSVFVWTPCGRDFRYFKGIQDSLGFWIPYLGFRILGNRLQSLSVELGFQVPWAVFRIPKPRNTDFPRFRIYWIPDSHEVMLPWLHETIRNDDF